jgi:hypothetical protein
MPTLTSFTFGTRVRGSVADRTGAVHAVAEEAKARLERVIAGLEA